MEGKIIHSSFCGATLRNDPSDSLCYLENQLRLGDFLFQQQGATQAQLSPGLVTFPPLRENETLMAPRLSGAGQRVLPDTF